jgi:hypothetical protein
MPSYLIHGRQTTRNTFQDVINNVGKEKAGYRKIQFCGEQADRDGI